MQYKLDLSLRTYFIFFLFIFIGFSSFAQEYRVANFTIVGNKHTKEDFIKKLVFTESDGVLDSLEIKKDMILLKRLPAVGNATFEVKYVKGYRYDVMYTIEENFTIIPSFNVYTSNDGEFAYRVGLSEFNFLGRDIIIGGFYQKDIYDSYGINFRAPYLFSKKAGIALSFTDFTSQEPVFFPGNTVDYKYNNVSFEILGLYEFNDKNKISLGLNAFTEDYQAKPDPGQIVPKEDFKVDKFLYKFIYEYNNLEYFYQYVSGFRSVFNYQYVRTQDHTNLDNFVIGWNDFLYYKRVGDKGNWANRFRFGLATNSDSPFAPFALDNNINIRGVGNTIDRGTGAMVFNTEYRYTLYEKKSFSLQGNVFVDAGAWRKPDGKLTDFVDGSTLRVFSGVGVRFIHKKIFNAIFRIDYGRGLTEGTQGLVFGIGQYF